MFEAKKTLIIVYKDEMLMNQLRKLIETRDDDEQGIVGARDDSINVVAWPEKVWLGNKKAGNIQGKILFLGDIKGTDKLIPVIDVKFDEYGVRYGWAGNQAVVYVDPKALKNREDYDGFLRKLAALPVPSFLKTTKESAAAAGTGQEAETAETGEKKEDVFEDVKKAFLVGVDAVGKVGTQIASMAEEVFRDKTLMKRQMLFYGVISLYNNGLEAFMNS